MKIKSLTMKNFGPYSNEVITIDLPDEGMMAQLGGNNGFGKSSLIRAFKTAIYGETDGIMLSNIANDINGNCVLDVKIDVKNTGWKIERGFSPNFVKAYVGDKDTPEDYGGIDAVKNKIKKEIVDLPYYIFSSILSLSVDDFKSFLTMKTADAKNIRDRIFGFYVINEIFEKVKNELNAAEKDYDTMNTKLATKTENLTYLQQQLTELKDKIETQIKKKLLELKQEFDKLKLKNEELKEVNVSKTSLLELYKAELNHTNLLTKYNNNETTLKEISIAKLDVETITKVVNGLDNQKLTMAKGVGEYERYQRYLDSNKAKDELKKLELEAAEITTKLENVELLETGTKIKNSLEEIKLLQTKSTALSTKLDTNNANLAKAVVAVEKLSTIVSEDKTALKEVERKIKLYEAGVCANCGTSFTDDAHKSELTIFVADRDKLITKISEAELKVKDMTGKINDAKPKLAAWKTEYDVMLSNLNNRILQHDGRDLAEEEMKIDAYFNRTDVDTIRGHNVNALKVRAQNVVSLSYTERSKLVDYEYTTPVVKPDEKEVEQLNTKLEDAKTKLSEATKKLANLEATIVTLPGNFDSNKVIEYVDHEANITKLTKELQDITTQSQVNTSRLKAIKTESEQLKLEGGKDQLESMNKMVANATDELSSLGTEIEQQKLKINYKRAQKHTLSDEGIKSHIIKEFVPFINANIQRLLANFQEVNLNLYFDSEFKAHIFRHGKEVALNTTSTGQKKILNFCILITMTKILKLKYPDINLIFYDEIFSSVHPINRTIILDIIEQEIKRDLNMSVVVVSHSHLPDSYFDKKFEVYKENNFSKLSTTNM